MSTAKNIEYCGVLWLESELPKPLCYYPISGAEFVSVVESYQAAHDLKISGVLDEATIEFIRAGKPAPDGLAKPKAAAKPAARPATKAAAPKPRTTPAPEPAEKPKTTRTRRRSKPKTMTGA